MHSAGISACQADYPCHMTITSEMLFTGMTMSNEKEKLMKKVGYNKLQDKQNQAASCLY